MAYYSALRQSESNTSRATVRLLEGLVRLSQAHARLCCQHQVLLYDAVVAIYCVSLSNTESATLGMHVLYYILYIIHICMQHILYYWFAKKNVYICVYTYIRTYMQRIFLT